jgi:hypothetical protein
VTCDVDVVTLTSAGAGWGLDLCGAPSCAVISVMSTRQRPRFRPYAATPGRALVQASADLLVLLWLVLWYYVGRAVHSAVAAVAAVGRQVQDGADGIAGNLDQASREASRIPLVGDRVSSPLRAAGSAARDLAGAGHGLDERATWLAIVLALAVAIPPVLAVLLPWLLLRLRFAYRAGAAAELARTAGGQEVLALRALANRPVRNVLAAAGENPVEAWRRGDGEVVARLATLELHASGAK